MMLPPFYRNQDSDFENRQMERFSNFRMKNDFGGDAD